MLFRSLLQEKGPQTAAQLAGAAGGRALSNTLLALCRKGLITREIQIRDGQSSILRRLWAVLAPQNLPDPETIIKLQRRAPRQAAVLLDLSQRDPEQLAAELAARHETDLATLRALEKKGWIRLEQREVYRVPKTAENMSVTTRLTLNEEQEAARRMIAEAMERQQFQVFLLRGITGSGKTEVYLQVIERALERGLGAIILVPEISLTPQTAARFYTRFPGQIAVLHSGLSDGERFDEWRRVRQGQVRIVVGARSAVFAPVRPLGVIVVDEEHDNSYKQGDIPRYHARDVAVMRARQENAVCVLGSATPSLESMANARSGKYVLLELNRRATGASLPEVRVIDTREEMRELPGMLMLSRELEEAVRDRLNRKEQVILLLNRRGFAPYVLCPQCGWIAECGQCQVSMTYHSADSRLKCHYCGEEKPVPSQCGQCGFSPVLYIGLGTQRLEDYLARVFPGARIERMDADTTSGKGGHARILSRFASGQIDILIGTQMLAKGHDYPGVTLVGVINADNGLAIPDFRAAENTFQLLCQVAGRAGRSPLGGRVIIQTYHPDLPLIRAAARHDYAAFYADELRARLAGRYPPFKRLARLVFSGSGAERAQREAEQMAARLRATVARRGEPGVEVVGPAPCFYPRLGGQHRWHILVRADHPERLLRDETLPLGWHVDIDPVDVL